MYERNGLYYVDTGNYITDSMNKTEALRYRSVWIYRRARDIFGLRPKKTIK